MTNTQFESLVDCMMDDIPAELGIVRQACVDEIFKLVPLIDTMIAQAFKAGKLDGMLTILAAQKEQRKEIAASVPF